MLVSASAVGLLLLAEPVVAFVYQHGHTKASDAAAIALCLQAYLVGLVPYSLVKIFAPGFYAVDRPRVPLFASAVGVAVNVGFNALTYRRLGAPGIALGTALGATANLVVLRLAFGRVVAPLPVERRWRRIGALLLANGILAAVVGGAWWAVARGLAALGPIGDARRTALLGVALAVVIAAGFGAFVGTLRLLRYPEADALWGLPRSLARRLPGRRR